MSSDGGGTQYAGTSLSGARRSAVETDPTRKPIGWKKPGEPTEWNDGVTADDQLVNDALRYKVDPKLIPGQRGTGLSREYLDNLSTLVQAKKLEEQATNKVKQEEEDKRQQGVRAAAVLASRNKMGLGRRDTILTSPQGLIGGTNYGQRKTLIGA